MQKKQQKQKGQPEEKTKDSESKETQLPKESILKPVEVQYCPICTLPFQYCEFGGKVDKCAQWKMKHKPELLPKEGQKIEGGAEKKEQKKEQPQQKKQKGSKAKKYVVYEVTDRTKKKHITTISGLQAYGINTKDFAKKCSKKFACSCNNVDDDKVQIQGDVSEALAEFLQKEYEVKEKYIVDLETYKKKIKKQQQKQGKKDQEKKEDKVDDKGEGKGENKGDEKPETQPTVPADSAD